MPKILPCGPAWLTSSTLTFPGVRPWIEIEHLFKHICILCPGEVPAAERFHRCRTMDARLAII